MSSAIIMVTGNKAYKLILGIEVLVGFLPVLMVFFMAAFSVPSLISQIITGPNRLMPTFLVSWFALGVSGVIGMYLLLDYIFIEKPKSFKSLKCAYGLCALGIIGVLIFGYMFSDVLGYISWALLLPVLVTLHFGNIAYRSFYEVR